MKKLIKKICYYSAAFLIVLPASLICFAFIIILIGLNIPYGRHLLEEKTPSLSGDMVHISGISGALPWDIKLKSLSVYDIKGAFVTLEDVHLSWAPLALFHADLKINDLSARHIFYKRAPIFAPSPQKKTKKSSNFSLPLGVEIADFDIGKIDIAPYALKKNLERALSLSLHSRAQIATIAPFMGDINLSHLPKMHIMLQLKRLDAQGGLNILLTHEQKWNGQIDYEEDQAGFATLLASLSELDPLSLHMRVKGALGALHHHFSLQAGVLKAELAGKVDLIDRHIESAVKISSPSLLVMPDIGWNNIALYGHVEGAFAHPHGSVFCDIDGLTLKGKSINHIELALNAEQDKYYFLGRVDALHLPNKPLLFGEAPLILKGDITPFSQEKPFQIALEHEILQLTLLGKLKPATQAHLQLNLPKLEPLAAIAGISLQGSTQLEGDIALASPQHKQDLITLKETFSFRGGQKQAVALVGENALLEAALVRDEAGLIKIDHVKFHGKDMDLLLHGLFSPFKAKDTKNHLPTDIEANLSLSHLSDLHKTLLGNLALEAHLQGFMDDLALKTHIDTLIGVHHQTLTVAPGALRLDLNAEHLPSHPDVKTSIEGFLDKSPFLLEGQFSHDDKILAYVNLHQLSWKSLQGKGVLTLPAGQKIPEGSMEIHLDKLQNFTHLIGQNISGSAVFSFITKSRNESQNAPKDLDFSLSSRLDMPHYHIDNLAIKGRLDDILGAPIADISFNVKNAHIKEALGDVVASLRGPENALALKMNGGFKNILNGAASFNVSLLENIPDKKLIIQNMALKLKKESMQMSQSVSVNYGDKLLISPFVLKIFSPYTHMPLMLDMGGSIKPRLAFNMSLSHLSPALLQDFIPSLKAEGDVQALAHLSGTLEKPQGTFALLGNGLHMLTEPAASLPKASFNMKTNLNGAFAHVSAGMNAGGDVDFSLNGDVPLTSKGALGGQVKGKVKLAILNAILGSSGMGVAGNFLFDLGVSGSLTKPALKGDISLVKGSFDHYAQGVHLQNINAHLQALGDKIHLQDVSLSAGAGTMKLIGDIGVLQPSIPLNLEFIMDKAQPIKSDMIEESINAHLHIQGQATTRINVDGKISLPNVTINIPNSLPSSVPQLEVIDLKKEDKKKKIDPPFIIGLNIDLNSPGNFFVRGHGLFAEMQGDLRIGGNNLAPEISGGFDLRRGNFNLAGINLNFSHGHVGFNGTGVGHKLDPILDFQADRNAAGILASLLVSGYASAPKIDFSSTPKKPKDEVLAILLFGTDRASLSATQLAQLGSAVVQLGGGQSFDPLGTVRNSLGLDHLAVGGGSSVGNGGTSIEAGKYVMKGVYVGAKEGMSGGGSQAQVKIDLTKNLKLNTVVGTGGQVTGFTTPDNDPGSSIGLSYGIDY